MTTKIRMVDVTMPPIIGAAILSDQTGNIKGTIFVAGKPTADVVVSFEDVPQDEGKARIAGIKTQKAVHGSAQHEIHSVHVLPVLVGTTVDFLNNDTNWHNVFSKSETKGFDLGLYPLGQKRSSTFEKGGVVRVLCNVHPAMEAFIVVKEHPFFAAHEINVMMRRKQLESAIRRTALSAMLGERRRSPRNRQRRN